MRFASDKSLSCQWTVIDNNAVKRLAKANCRHEIAVTRLASERSNFERSSLTPQEDAEARKYGTKWVGQLRGFPFAR
jgi:hypothetical protein